MIDGRDVKEQIGTSLDGADISSDKHNYSLYVDADFGHDDYGDYYVEITESDSQKNVDTLQNAYNQADMEDRDAWDSKLSEIASDIAKAINAFEEEEE